jgi:DNA polymerase-1
MKGEPEGLYFSDGSFTTYLEFTTENRAQISRMLSGGDPLYMHNSKFAQVMLERCGVRLADVKEDTLLLSYCVNPSFSGESLSEHLTQYLGASVDEAKNPDQAAAMIPSLVAALHKELEEPVTSVYRQVELPLSPVLARMETAGIKVDARVLSVQSKELDGRIEGLTQEVYRLAEGQFNINSPRQLGVVLFEKLSLPAKKKTKTGYSTSVEVLEELYEAHPIIPMIMEYRSLSKLKTTYVDALPQSINPKTGRVHTIFKQAVTATGRLSSVEPNLQNIPIRSEEGVKVRRAFVAEPGKVLLSADYSQIDLRALAHMSKDDNTYALSARGKIFIPSPLRRSSRCLSNGLIPPCEDGPRL